MPGWRSMTRLFDFMLSGKTNERDSFCLVPAVPNSFGKTENWWLGCTVVG